MYGDDEQRKSDEEYMRELYRRFRKEVDGGEPVDYYELNELLDIYDYAQDEGDLLVQFFVFLTASRYYPDSHAFDERMGFFLSYVSSDAATDMIARQGREETPLWDVLEMGIKCYPAGDPAPYLNRIIEKYDKIDCETSLKIIDLLREMRAYKLLENYYFQLSMMVEEPVSFYFEVAETLKESEETKQAARAAAELIIKQDPFNIDAWLLVARLEFGMQHPKEALSAVEYALAMDPQHFNARVTRGVILVGCEGKQQEAVDLLKEILKEDPKNIFALEGIAEAYNRLGMKAEACEAYADIIRNDLAESAVNDPIIEIIKLEPENLEQYLELILSKNLVAEDGWFDKLAPLFENQRIDLAARVIDFYYRKLGVIRDYNIFIALLYDAGMFERLIEVVEEAYSNPDSKDAIMKSFKLADHLVVTSAYLRLGHRETAAHLSEAIMQSYEPGDGLTNVLLNRGISLTAKFIHDIATTENLEVNFREVDPLSHIDPRALNIANLNFSDKVSEEKNLEPGRKEESGK